MELSELKTRIMSSFNGSPEDLEAVLHMAEENRPIFPFNDYEYLICKLIEQGVLSFEQYIDLRTEYISTNPNLWIFEISAPRGFREKFAHTYLQKKCTTLKKPTKELDPQYSNNYDLWLDGIRIEVKASRAVDSDSDEPLYMKALSRNTHKNFLMNFQQLKPNHCDVFIWVAVFIDQIVLWIMSSNEVRQHPLYSDGQHRGNKGNEGQLHITQDNVDQLAPYELFGDNLEQAIRDAAQRSL